MADPVTIEFSWRSMLTLAVCLPILVAAVLLVLGKNEQSANRFLAAFLLVTIIAQIPQIIGFAGFYQKWPGLTFAPFNVDLYAGALIYLHADRLMQARPLGWRKWLLLPGVMQTLYYTWAFVFLGDYKAKWAYNDAIHEPFIKPVETFLAIGMMLIAIIVIFRMMTDYRRFLINTQSAARDFEPRWLRRLMIAVIIAGCFFLVLELTPLLIAPVSYVSAYPVELLLTATIGWLGLDALGQTSTKFPKMPAEGALSTTPQLQTPVTETKNWQAEGEQLRETVLSESWFLEPRVTIGQIAQRMGSNETYISKSLNQGLGLTFNAFINGLRVEHAKGLIQQGSRSLLEIAFASGFNSKATFNRVFRDVAGETPSKFKTSQNP